MNFKFLLKGITLVLFSSMVFAEDEEVMKGDCKDIVDFFGERNKTSSLTQCEVDKDGKVITVGLNSYFITEDCVKKALSYDSITKLIYTKIGSTPSHNPEYNIVPPEIANLTKLEDFTFGYGGYRSYARTALLEGQLRLSKSLKRLKISGVTALQCNIDDISTLTNLEELDFKYFNRPAEPINFEPLKSLNNLSILSLSNEGYIPLDDLPEAVYLSAKTIKNITIHGHTLDKISDKISNLKHLIH
eukprot:jgi/Orpsp1_1/1188217/evm.model.d7180000063279.1